MIRPHIHVILATDDIPPPLPAALHNINATTSYWPLSEALRHYELIVADAIVIVTPANVGVLTDSLQSLLERIAQRPRATLLLRPPDTPLTPLPHASTLPVSFSDTDSVTELTTRLNLMVEMRASLDALHGGLLATRRTGEGVARRYANQLRLASRLQREFLPDMLPRIGPFSFDLLFYPADYVSGDIYDVHRLDEEHVGIALADATGHGIPAALLTVYIKRALRGKEIENGTYRILSPDEVLYRLNDDILDAQLNECPFVAAIYAVLNIRTRELHLARGGTPYPLQRHADGTVDVISGRGGVVGVMPDTFFEVSTVQLEPGDALLLYSDGLERLVAPELGDADVPETLRRRAEQITGPALTTVGSNNGSGGVAVAECPAATIAPVAASPWCETLQQHGATAALELIAQRQRSLRRIGYPLDDITVLGIQLDADAPPLF